MTENHEHDVFRQPTPREQQEKEAEQQRRDLEEQRKRGDKQSDEDNK